MLRVVKVGKEYRQGSTPSSHPLERKIMSEYDEPVPTGKLGVDAVMGGQRNPQEELVQLLEQYCKFRKDYNANLIASELRHSWYWKVTDSIDIDHTFTVKDEEPPSDELRSKIMEILKICPVQRPPLIP